MDKFFAVTAMSVIVTFNSYVAVFRYTDFPQPEPTIKAERTSPAFFDVGSSFASRFYTHPHPGNFAVWASSAY
jgi:hypothetical protein